MAAFPKFSQGEKDKKAEEQDKTEETAVEDSIQDDLDPSAWYQKRINEVGLAKATKEFKIKFK